MNIHLQGIDPRVELSHYNEIIDRRRQTLGLTEATSLPSVLLLDSKDDRKNYLLALAAVKLYESAHGSRGIHTLTDMKEYIELVNELSKAQKQTPASELRTFSLDLLRSMRNELYAKSA